MGFQFLSLTILRNLQNKKIVRDMNFVGKNVKRVSLINELSEINI
jgi:hypothetical protein